MKIPRAFLSFTENIEDFYVSRKKIVDEATCCLLFEKPAVPFHFSSLNLFAIISFLEIKTSYDLRDCQREENQGAIVV